MYYIKKIHDVKGFLLIAIILTGFWFLMSPKFDLTNIVLGGGCAVGITYFWSQDLFRSGKPMRFTPVQLGKLFIYLIHLGYNILLANIAVAVIVLSREMPISPGFILVKTKLQKDLTKVLYANSITLTPGTITINLNNDRLLVHALTKDAAHGVHDWYLQDRLRDIEVSGNG
ncbi:MAG: Na+/H+ antiporter subunit E [Bacillota bacterium]|nr:Na+/H+ antiporter subunit E [Bacillota bacterium]MDW7683102.1 Na+/H+ antiporter subunit E [Bacillota bacterium]